MSRRPHCWMPLVLFLVATPARSDNSDTEPQLRWEGFIRSILESESLKNGEQWHEGRLTLKTKRRKGVRAELEFEVETRSDTLDVREIVFDRKFDDGSRFEAGYTQKRIGLEYEEDREERATVERSLIYRRLELFTYVGRETLLRWHREDASGLFHDWSFTLGVSESQSGSVVGNWQAEVNDGGLRFGTWVMLGSDKVEGGQQASFVLMNSLWQRGVDRSWQVEWAVGLDPNQSEFEQIFDDDQRVLFTGLTGQGALTVWREDEEQIALAVGTSLVVIDHREPRYNSLGVLAGLRYTWDNFRLSAEIELIGTNSPIELEERTYDESRAAFEAIYFF